MNMLNIRMVIACFGVLISASLLAASATPAEEARRPGDDEHGTLHVQGESIHYSDLPSPAAKRNFIESTRGFERLSDLSKREPLAIQEARAQLDRTPMIPGIERLRKMFAVEITPTVIAGVQTDIVEPASGIFSANKHRVLINLHGSGFQVGARFGGQMESIPT